MNEERSGKFVPLINKYPNLITNDRLGGGFHGDTETPEQYVPATGFPGRHWEVCMTMNDTWGYKYNENNWKSVKTLLQTLVDIVSKGGNYLLNVGPTPEGLIPDASAERLQEVGKWMKTNGESIYGTKASPFHYLPWGRSTQKGNKVYLHVFDWPHNGQLVVSSLLSKIKKAYLLADPDKKLKIKGSSTKVSIQLPASAPDENVSVIVLELDGIPDVLPIPSAGKKVKVSSELRGYGAANLTDGDPKSSWKPQKNDQDIWAEIDLGEEMTVQAVSVVEPWRLWDKKGQTCEFQYFADNGWKQAAVFTTKGTGHIENIKTLKAKKFRLKIIESKEPLLNEWILYRGE